MRYSAHVSESSPKKRVEQRAQVRVLHGGDQLAQVGLHLVGRRGGPSSRSARSNVPGSAGPSGADRDLRAPALVDLVAPDDVHRRARAAELAHCGDVVPDHRRDAAGAVAEDQLEELAAVAPLAPVGLADQEDLVEVGAVLKVANEHGGKVTRPADGPWRLRTLVASSSQIVEQSTRDVARPSPSRRSVLRHHRHRAGARSGGASAVTVGAVRIALGAAAPARGRASPPAARPLRLARGPLAVGGLGVAGYQLCFFAAVKDTGVAVGTVVALGSAPALAGAGGWLLDRRGPDRAWWSRRRWPARGVALLALAGWGSEVSAPGVLLAVGAGASYAAFTLASKRLLDAGHGVERVMA